MGSSFDYTQMAILKVGWTFFWCFSLSVSEGRAKEECLNYLFFLNPFDVILILVIKKNLWYALPHLFYYLFLFQRYLCPQNLSICALCVPSIRNPRPLHHFAVLQLLFLNFSLIFLQLHGESMGTKRETWGKRRKEKRDREGSRARWWKLRSQTGKLIFFFGIPIYFFFFLTESDTEYKLIHLLAGACYNTPGDSESETSLWWIRRKVEEI